MTEKIDAVILAGGKGKRLGDIGEKKQKVTLGIQKTILEHNISILEKYCKKIIIIVGYRKEDIIENLKKIKTNANIVLVDQREPRGTAHAIKFSENYVENGFIVIFGDNFIEENDFKKIITEKPFAFGVAQVKDVSKLGVFKIENGFITDVVEKPNKGEEPSNLVHCGINLYDKRIFGAIRKTKINPIRNEYEITDTYKILISEGVKIKPVLIERPLHITTEEEAKQAGLI